MSNEKLYCGIDIGSTNHSLVVLNMQGKIVLKKNIDHRFTVFNEIIISLKNLEKENVAEVIIGLEGQSGYATPFDRLLKEAGFKLYNIDSLKLNNFRKIYGTENKNDERDAELIALFIKSKSQFESENEKAFTELKVRSIMNEKIRLLIHHQQSIIEERVRYMQRLEKHLLGFCPELLEIGSLKNISVLNYLIYYSNPQKYKNMTLKKLIKISSIGEKKAAEMLPKLTNVKYDEKLTEEFSYIIKSLAAKILDLINEENEIEKKLEDISTDDEDMKILTSIEGCAAKSAGILSGEIGNIQNFKGESQLASYCGVACIDNSSGKKEAVKKNKKINKLCKFALMQVANAARQFNEESKKYYNKKRTEFGFKKKGSHLHAIRCLARQLVKVIFKLLTSKKEYVVKNIEVAVI